MATRSKVPPIGSAQWILDERHQANDLVNQEVEDFSFSVRNELDWLNEHMADIFAEQGLNLMEVFKTPGKLRGKTPRTTRKQKPGERKALTPICASNTHNRGSPAQRSAQKSIQKSAAKSKLHIAQDAENIIASSSPVARALFTKPQPSKGKGKSKQTVEPAPRPNAVPVAQDKVDVDPAHSFPRPPQWGFPGSSQDTVSTQQDNIFSQPMTQSTQPSVYTQPSFDTHRRDTSVSFVSAKEDFGSHRTSEEHPPERDVDRMSIDHDKPEDNTTEMGKTVVPHVRHAPSETDADSSHGSPASNGTVVHYDLQDAAENTSHSHSAPSHDGSDDNRGFPDHDLATLQRERDIDRGVESQKVPVAAQYDEMEIASPVPAEPLNAVDQMDVDDVRSPSDGSSPVKPLVRKSSLTFAALPAREPLPNKSIGARVSRTSHLDASRSRSSHLSRTTGGKSLGASQFAHASETHHEDEMEVDDDRAEPSNSTSETTKMHNKTSTQRLHERINMLKQKNEQAAQPSYPQLRTVEEDQQRTSKTPLFSHPEARANSALAVDDDDDEDWIAPVKPPVPTMNVARQPLFSQMSADEPSNNNDPQKSPVRSLFSQSQMSPRRPGLINHAKSISTTQVPSPSKGTLANEVRHAKHMSQPDLHSVVESTTPPGSPAIKKNMDGPLSASKAKFYSVLKAAKDKVIGSSATSAQAKLDALQNSPRRPALQPTLSAEDIFSPKRGEKTGNGLFSHFRSPSKESDKSGKSGKTLGSPFSPVRKTRSSTERERQMEREADAQKRNEDKLEKMREREKQKAAAYQKERVAAVKTPTSPSKRIAPVEEDRPTSPEDMPPPQPPKSLLPTGPGHKLREPRRLANKTQPKEPVPKAKPQVIRVNLANNRFGQTNNAGAMAPPPPKQQPEAVLKSSTDSLRSATSQPAASTRANRALTAAANKKKEEERKALEKKQAAAAAAKAREEKIQAERERQQAERERLNRIRQEKQRKEEEERKAKEEERKAREEERKAREARAAALKQAQEAKRAEAQQQKHGLSLYSSQKPQAPAARVRADLAASRPITQMHTVGEANRNIVVPPVNPAKPAKRVFQPEDDEPVHKSTLQRAGNAYQPVEGKRRRTFEEDESPEQMRAKPMRPSVKAPPIRQSNIRKDVQNQNKYPASGYATHGQMQQSASTMTSMLKTATTTHAHNMQFANGKIPFAESSNAQGGPSFKTPGRPMGPPAAKSAAKSSPHYPNGENIALPDILTDSEEEDSDNEFNPPSWANSPALREILAQQQLVDPETVFGPIAPLQMEQVFPNKERHKRFRERTSSAYWVNDQVTEEDKRKDREARERLAQVGAWTYDPSPLSKNAGK